jgi:hypothetical protein
MARFADPDGFGVKIPQIEHVRLTPGARLKETFCLTIPG